jgi:hypothetical protein
VELSTDSMGAHLAVWYKQQRWLGDVSGIFSSQRWLLWLVGIFGRFEMQFFLNMFNLDLQSGVVISLKIYLCILIGSRKTRKTRF